MRKQMPVEESYTIDFNKGDIIIKQSGMYLIIAGPQLGKVRARHSPAGSIFG